MATSTRKTGEVNRNGQRLVDKTERPGNDHLQYIWIKWAALHYAKRGASRPASRRRASLVIEQCAAPLGLSFYLQPHSSCPAVRVSSPSERSVGMAGKIFMAKIGVLGVPS